jgi:RHS repeat-associated protein
MYLKNAMLNISNTAYDSSAAEDDNNTSSSNEETDTEITYPYHGSVSTYDSYGNTITTKKGSVIKDSNDEEVIDTSKPFISTSSTYDSTGNYVTSEVDASGNTVSYTVDTSTGNTTKVTDAMGNETDYSYDVVGNLTSISSSSTSNTYTYNSVNQLSAISHNEFSYNFNYDVYNHLLSTVIGDTALVTNTYDSNNGNLKKTTYGNSQGLTYSYDDYDRVTSISSIVDGPLVSYTYNKKGLVTKAVERKSGQITEFQYDCNGNLLRKNTTSNDGNTIAYSSGYDSSGNPTETLNINGETRTVTSGTDDSDNSYIDNGDSKVITFTDSLGRTESVNQVDKSTNKSLETSYQYLTGAESSSTTELVSEYIQSYDGTDLVDYQYTYDANGNITEIKDNNTVIFKYKYDSLNQLKEEYNYIQNYYINYSYDGNGNILAQHTQRLDPTYGYPTGKDFGNAFYYNDSEWKDKLTKINNSEITYDAIGNPLNYRDGMTMKWQVGRELAGITLDDNTSISYTYNTDGMRTCKNVGGTKTYYYYDDSNNLVGLTQGSTTMFFYYDSDNSPVSMSYNGTMYYYVKDLQGDIVKIINKNGTVYGTYTYDSWGNIVSSTGDSSVSRLNPLRYRGYVYDNDTKLYYLQSRYYDPAIGRFVNPDVYFDTDTGTLLSTNMYSYCENNPIISRDLDGRCTAVLASVAVAGASNSWNPVGWVLIGVAIGVTIVYAVDKYQSYNPDPYARPNQKKQGRELKNKARKKSTWKPKKTPKKPKKHTPGKDHRKYK